MAGNQNSGRKSLEEEIAAVKERMRQEALEEVAKRVVYRKLEQLEEVPTDIGVKEIALPITLRSMTEKKDISGDININISKEISDKHETNASTSDNSEGQAQV